MGGSSETKPDEQQRRMSLSSDNSTVYALQNDVASSLRTWYGMRKVSRARVVKKARTALPMPDTLRFFSRGVSMLTFLATLTAMTTLVIVILASMKVVDPNIKPDVPTATSLVPAGPTFAPQPHAGVSISANEAAAALLGDNTVALNSTNITSEAVGPGVVNGASGTPLESMPARADISTVVQDRTGITALQFLWMLSPSFSCLVLYLTMTRWMRQTEEDRAEKAAAADSAATQVRGSPDTPDATAQTDARQPQNDSAQQADLSHLHDAALSNVVAQTLSPPARPSPSVPSVAAASSHRPKMQMHVTVPRPQSMQLTNLAILSSPLEGETASLLASRTSTPSASPAPHTPAAPASLGLLTQPGLASALLLPPETPMPSSSTPLPDTPMAETPMTPSDQDNETLLPGNDKVACEPISEESPSQLFSPTTDSSVKVSTDTAPTGTDDRNESVSEKDIQSKARHSEGLTEVQLEEDRPASPSVSFAPSVDVASSPTPSLSPDPSASPMPCLSPAHVAQVNVDKIARVSLTYVTPTVVSNANQDDAQPNNQSKTNEHRSLLIDCTQSMPFLLPFMGMGFPTLLAESRGGKHLMDSQPWYERIGMRLLLATHLPRPSVLLSRWLFRTQFVTTARWPPFLAFLAAAVALPTVLPAVAALLQYLIACITGSQGWYDETALSLLYVSFGFGPSVKAGWAIVVGFLYELVAGVWWDVIPISSADWGNGLGFVGASWIILAFCEEMGWMGGMFPLAFCSRQLRMLSQKLTRAVYGNPQLHVVEAGDNGVSVATATASPFTPLCAEWIHLSVSCFVTGVVWSAWHWPYILLQDYLPEGVGYVPGTVDTPLGYGFCAWVPRIIATRFVTMALTLHANTYWAGVVFHAAHNVMVYSYWARLPDTDGVRFPFARYMHAESGITVVVLYCLAAVFVVHTWKRSEEHQMRVDHSKQRHRAKLAHHAHSHRRHSHSMESSLLPTQQSQHPSAPSTIQAADAVLSQ